MISTLLPVRYDFVAANNTARDAQIYSFLKMMLISGLDIAKAKYLYNIITIAPMLYLLR